MRAIPLMPFRTIAVDRDRFKMGTVFFVPELRGKTVLGQWRVLHP